MRLYRFDTDFFKLIDTEQKAYWLGFISADGWIEPKLNRLGIGLQKSDRKHLEKFRDAINSNHPIYEKRDSSYFRISSKELIADLNNVGVFPAKSLKIDPYYVSEPLQHHYWRGVFDGDGWIQKDKLNRWLIGICGSKAMVEGFQRFVLDMATSSAKIYMINNTYCIQFGGVHFTRMIMDEMYSDATVFLDRKYEKWLEVSDQKTFRATRMKLGQKIC